MSRIQLTTGLLGTQSRQRCGIVSFAGAQLYVSWQAVCEGEGGEGGLKKHALILS